MWIVQKTDSLTTKMLLSDFQQAAGSPWRATLPELHSTQHCGKCYPQIHLKFTESVTKSAVTRLRSKFATIWGRTVGELGITANTLPTELPILGCAINVVQSGRPAGYSRHVPRQLIKLEWRDSHCHAIQNVASKTSLVALIRSIILHAAHVRGQMD